MTLAVRHYSSGAEIVASYHAIRQRLMRPKNGIIEKQDRVVHMFDEPYHPAINLTREPTAEEIANEPKAHVTAWVDWNIERCASGKDLTSFLRWTCRKHGFDIEEIIGCSRRAPVVRKRRIVIHEAYMAFPGISLYELGRAVGGRDHSTIWYALVKMGDKVGLPDDRERRVQFCDRPEIMEMLKSMYLSGIGPKAIEKQTGISKSTVHRLARDYHWKASHLPKGKE